MRSAGVSGISLGILLAAPFGNVPAAAQTSVAASIVSDDRFRGYSLSDGRPVGILDLSYDDVSGLYGTVSGSLVASPREGLQPLRLLLNGGYSKRLPSGLTIDGGVTHSEYSRYSSRTEERSYTEVYVGLSSKRITGRIYVSPDYEEHGSLYGELNGYFPLATRLRLSGHIGLLVPLGPYDHGNRRDLDWRLGLARQFGRLSVQGAWTGVLPGHDRYRYDSQGRQALVVALSYGL